MKHLLDILLIPCLIGLAIYIVAYTIIFVKYGKEIKKETNKKMKEKYPTWPYVPRQKTDFASFPLNMWNDD